MYTVYILKSEKYCRTYVGITTDLKSRLLEHNMGYSNFTKKYLPWYIVYKEFVDSRENARRREKYFKSAAGRRFIKKNIFNIPQ